MKKPTKRIRDLSSCSVFCLLAFRIVNAFLVHDTLKTSRMKCFRDFSALSCADKRRRVNLQIAIDPTVQKNSAAFKNKGSIKIPRGGGSPKSTTTRRLRMTKSPEQVETELLCALEALQKTWTTYKDRDFRIQENKRNVLDMLLFPTVRECNAALAAFGDAGDLLRALRLFVKMRKASTLQQLLQSKTTRLVCPVPAPTMVTYSTLMSRAVKLSKPRVALRLWNLMEPGMNIDIRAANIRMNCYAKLADPRQAQDLLHQLKTGCGPDVPQLEPNLVTYNTLIDACHRAGDLDAAMAAAQDMMEQQIEPDARTYTSLIATVARRKSLASGRNDPTFAFAFLREMQDRGVRPNGITYSALIDACGRCRRSDLALKGLRIMLRQKAQEQKELGDARYVLANEVGAWSAAIDACGKAGRLETAKRLFFAMPSFGVLPNTITCGSLTDSLLRAGRTAETLDVLRYMKNHGIVPSEVMYTSLMTRAERLVQIENKRYRYPDMLRKDKENESSDARAIDVYTELMQSLMDGGQRRLRVGGKARGQTKEDSHKLMIKVFLVFQEMKSVGAKPDLACFNALLCACARAGDFEHAQDVLSQIKAADLDPNDASWRQLIRTAATMRRSDLAMACWKQALLYRRSRRIVDEPQQIWRPSVESVAALATAFLREADVVERGGKERLYRKMVGLYEDLLMGKQEMGFDLVDLDALLNNHRAMLLLLRGVVALQDLTSSAEEKEKLRKTATSILELECFRDILSFRLSWNEKQTLQRARGWI